jgi:crotonobetainyl-CoA:carnitine CoA-transferase CaiB-like acyl-CoA transferase
VALACTSDKMWERFARLMGKPELAEKYPTSAIRVENRHTVNGIVADWVGSMPLTQVLEEASKGEVPCAQIYSVKDIFSDAQFAARGNMMTVSDERVGELVLPSPVLKLSETPTVFRHAGRALGADNESVYCELLGLSAEQVRSFAEAGVI